MISAAGESLGKYQIIEEVGRGPFGIVYKGQASFINRHVAIKVLDPYLALDTNLVTQFLDEAKQAAQLRHPNLVPIHEIPRQGPPYFFVMDYLPGESLATIIQKQGPLPPGWVVPVIAQVASALDYLHSQGLVHQGVKPSNIIVSAGGRAVLTDFGIARAAERAQLPCRGIALETALYMAPEQVKTDGATAASDLYALGVVTYEMLTGHPPFTAATPMAVFMRHAFEAPPDMDRTASQVSESVEGAVRWVLEKDPQSRPESASAFVMSLNHAVHGHTLEPELILPSPLSAHIPGPERAIIASGTDQESSDDEGWAITTEGSLSTPAVERKLWQNLFERQSRPALTAAETTLSPNRVLVVLSLLIIAALVGLIPLLVRIFCRC